MEKNAYQSGLLVAELRQMLDDPTEAAKIPKLEHESSGAIAKVEQAERDLEQINVAVSAIKHWQAGESAYHQRSFLGKILFRRNGRPIRALRRILFHTNGKPRGIFRSWVLKSNGTPRKPFRQWMAGEKYLSLPKAYGKAPAAPPTIPAPTSFSWDESPFGSDTPIERTLAGMPVAEDSRGVLIIDSVYPTPDRDSGSVDAINYARIFQMMGYSVYFAATSNFTSRTLDNVAIRAKRNLESMGVTAIDDTHISSINDLIRSKGCFFDIFFLSRVDVGGRFFEIARAYSQDSKVVFNTVDLHFVRELREGQLKNDRLKINEALRTREREIYLTRLADATIVVSSEEVKLLEQEVPGASVYEVPLIRDVPGGSTDFRDRYDIGFIGGYKHLPNIDAVEYFLDTVWPLVLQELPGVKFHLMGADMPDELRRRTDPGLVVLGHVPDVREAFERLRLTVAPLRFGAGAKGKVVSSLSHGVPCICSSIAAEGMPLGKAAGILVADDPEEFANLVIRAYRDQSLWQELSASGLQLMRKRHAFDAGFERMTAIVQKLELHDPAAQKGVNPEEQ